MAIVRGYSDLDRHASWFLFFSLLLRAIMQAGLTPLAIVGLSCRFDAEDLLEKRVLSRFSRRKLYLYNTLTYADYSYTFKQLLSVPPDLAGQ